MNEVYEFLKKCGVYYPAAAEENQPRVRPFGTGAAQICSFSEEPRRIVF